MLSELIGGVMGRTVSISVIIPALNEAGRIEACLNSLLNQTIGRENFEIIVVDNGSNDQTVELSKLIADLVRIAPGVTVGRLRNIGVESSKGEILAFIDADCVADPNWLKAGRGVLKEDAVVAVGNRYDFGERGSWIEQIWFGTPEQGQRESNELWAGNLIVKKDAFVSAGGFDETLVSYEDIVLTEQLLKKGRILFDDKVRVTHLGGPKNLMEFFRQQLWHEFEWPVVCWRGSRLLYLGSTLFSFVGYILLISSLFCSAPLNVILLSVGVLLIAAPGAKLLIARIIRKGERRYKLLLGMFVLRILHMFARLVAGVIRVTGFHWSGRRKRSAHSLQHISPVKPTT